MLARVFWVTTWTVALSWWSSVICLSPGFVMPVCCRCFLRLFRSSFDIVVVASGCFDVTGLITFSIRWFMSVMSYTLSWNYLLGDVNTQRASKKPWRHYAAVSPLLRITSSACPLCPNKDTKPGERFYVEGLSHNATYPSPISTDRGRKGIDSVWKTMISADGISTTKIFPESFL